MNVVNSTVTSFQPDLRTRKRMRERSLSPDMFLDVTDEDEEENCHFQKADNLKQFDSTEEPNGVLYTTANNITQCPKSPLSECNPNKPQILMSSLLSQQGKESYSTVGDSKIQISCCINSLKSTAGANNFGLNTKMREILRSGSQTVSKVEYSSHSTIEQSPCPAVYTLNNNKTQTQPSKHFGTNYGLSDSTWKTIQQAREIKQLYEWQKECLNSAIKTDRNLIYSLPTSGGKTLVAELLMIRDLLCQRKDCLYVLPYVSIVQEKIRTLSSLAIALDFTVEEYAADKGTFPPRKRKSKQVIYIATLEKSHGIINCLMELGRLSEIGLVVVDEIHIIGEGRRGATLEILLCKLLLAPVAPRIVAMSATIGNINELSQFLHADIYTKEFRPVKLREFIKTGDQLLEVRNSQFRCQENVLIPARSLPVSSSISLKYDPDGLGFLVSEVAPEHSCLVFCATKVNCESVSQLIVRQLPPAMLQWKVNEKRALRRALEQQSGKICPILKMTLPYGVAYHHSGLTVDERQLIEEAFSSSILCCLCCTSTLAAGVNLPARRVILRAPYIGLDRLTRARYQQMIGRAGRAGLDTHGESILIAQPLEMPFVTNEILLAPIDHVQSQLGQDGLQGLRQLILGLLYLDLGGKERKTLCETLRHSTLFGLQNSLQEATNIDELVDQSLKAMEVMDFIFVELDGKLSLSKLGRATLKGNIDLDRSTQLVSDLRFTQTSQVLVTKLHLLYLITPFHLVGTIRPASSAYLEAFNRLTSEEVDVARRLGISESVVSQLVMGLEPKVERFVIERFYLTLILNDVYKGNSFWKIAESYYCNRGHVQNLLACAVSFVSCVHHFVQEFGEFWGLSDLLLTFSRELSMCCSSELLSLMELPAVAKGRARLLYTAGFRSLTDVAKSHPDELVSRVEHLSRQVAHHMVAAARVLVYDKVDSLRDEADSLLEMVPKTPLKPLDNTLTAQDKSTTEN